MTWTPPPLDPAAAELATLVSVAVHIEPELLRHVRLRLMTGTDVGAEADLWFSPWIATRAADSIVLRAEVASWLRTRLAERLAAPDTPHDPAHRVWDLIADLHGSASPALLLEERLTWLSLLPGDHLDEIEAALRPAVNAVVTEGRSGVADWFGGAWARLPDAVRGTRAAWQLAHLASRGEQAGPYAPASLGLGDVHIIAPHMPQTDLMIERRDGVVILGGERGTAVPVAQTEPSIAAVSWFDTEAVRTSTVRITSESPVEVTVGESPLVWLHTADGTIHEIGTAPAGSRAHLWVYDEPTAGWPRVDLLWKLLRLAGVDIRIHSSLTDDSPPRSEDCVILLCQSTHDPEVVRFFGDTPVLSVMFEGDQAGDLAPMGGRQTVVRVTDLTPGGIQPLVAELTGVLSSAGAKTTPWAVLIESRHHLWRCYGVLIDGRRVLTVLPETARGDSDDLSVTFQVDGFRSAVAVRAMFHHSPVTLIDLAGAPPAAAVPAAVRKPTAAQLWDDTWHTAGSFRDSRAIATVRGTFGRPMPDGRIAISPLTTSPSVWSGAALWSAAFDGIVALVVSGPGSTGQEALLLHDLDQWFPPPKPAEPAPRPQRPPASGDWEFARLEYRPTGSLGNDRFMDWTATFHHPGGVLRWGTDERFDDLRHLNRAGRVGWQVYQRHAMSDPEQPHRLTGVTYVLRRRIP
ncbi:hypothetical protein [Actinoplanes subglobosus]|uniref:Uncharacterized protein n=1 Tax=Actinoplanes subglobosus TaxID=1547892 RepID=A0ABV8J3R7_9ACTN